MLLWLVSFCGWAMILWAFKHTFLKFKELTIRIRADRKYSCCLLEYACVCVRVPKWVSLYLLRV